MDEEKKHTENKTAVLLSQPYVEVYCGGRTFSVATALFQEVDFLREWLAGDDTLAKIELPSTVSADSFQRLLSLLHFVATFPESNLVPKINDIVTLEDYQQDVMCAHFLGATAILNMYDVHISATWSDWNLDWIKTAVFADTHYLHRLLAACINSVDTEQLQQTLIDKSLNLSNDGFRHAMTARLVNQVFLC